MELWNILILFLIPYIRIPVQVNWALCETINHLTITYEAIWHDFYSKLQNCTSRFLLPGYIGLIGGYYNLGVPLGVPLRVRCSSCMQGTFRVLCTVTVNFQHTLQVQSLVLHFAVASMVLCHTGPMLPVGRIWICTILIIPIMTDSYRYSQLDMYLSHPDLK